MNEVVFVTIIGKISFQRGGIWQKSFLLTLITSLTEGRLHRNVVVETIVVVRTVSIDTVQLH